MRFYRSRWVNMRPQRPAQLHLAERKRERHGRKRDQHPRFRIQAMKRETEEEWGRGGWQTLLVVAVRCGSASSTSRTLAVSGRACPITVATLAPHAVPSSRAVRRRRRDALGERQIDYRRRGRVLHLEPSGERRGDTVPRSRHPNLAE
jgi:hypothetical protein